jgi:hypothetical protein
MNNIRFEYLYRDGSNYKKWSEVVFSNPDNVRIERIAKQLNEAFMQDGLFIAHQVRVPEVFLAAEDHLTEDDHCFHEFAEVTETAEMPSDLHRRSISEFLREVLTESQSGWRAFDPTDRLFRRYR